MKGRPRSRERPLGDRDTVACGCAGGLLAPGLARPPHRPVHHRQRGDARHPDALLGLDTRIPGDVSVIGFDDAEWTTLIRPRLSVVSQPVQELGGLAADILIRRINGAAARPRRHTLNTTYIAREP
ncbi:substrate-binding domain-containing protein [Streptomyces sp. NPDC052727]|uniref:substrate-binding domain-containing protein n=1 Tax=Streptomyces sp. NPDC052727 TaxID=3154854 RepID=UPI0034336466